MNPKDDPRLGLPSASSALEDSLCKGRWQLQKVYDQINGPEEETAPDPEAESGNRVHLLYAGESCPEATQAEHDRAEKAVQIDQRIYLRWIEHLGISSDLPITCLREYRWWLKDEAGEKIYSGQTDAIWIRGKVGGPADVLIADLKGLWGYHDDATLNMQLRRYVALVYSCIADLGFTEVRSAWTYLNQPAVTLQPKIAVYNREEMEESVFFMLLDLSLMNSEGAPRTAGPIQCHRCRAKMICGEYLESVSELPAPVQTKLPPPTKERIFDRMAVIDGEALAEVLRWVPALQNMADMAKAEAKRRLGQNQFSVPGFQLTPNSPRSKITDLIKLWNRMTSQYNVSGEEFLKVCTMSNEAFEKMLRAHSGLKGQKLDERMAVLLEGTTTPIHVSDSVTEVRL